MTRNTLHSTRDFRLLSTDPPESSEPFARKLGSYQLALQTFNARSESRRRRAKTRCQGHGALHSAGLLSSAYLPERNLLTSNARALSSLQRSRSGLTFSMVCLFRRTSVFFARGRTLRPGFSLATVQPRTRRSSQPPASRSTSAMTTRSPIFTARPRLRLGFCHTPSFQRMKSASINPLPQGIQSVAKPSALSFF